MLKLSRRAHSTDDKQGPRSLGCSLRLRGSKGNLDAAKVFAELGAATAESVNDESGMMRCVEILALCEMDEGQYKRARRHLQDNLARSSAVGDQRAGAVTMGNLGRLSMLEERYEAAARNSRSIALT